MPDSYYMWFELTDKGVQNPKVQPIIKTNVQDVIEQYVASLSDNEELEKVPKVIKNIEKYTTQWGGEWNKDKEEQFETWVEEGFNAVLNTELRQLAKEHLTSWKYYEGLHLESVDTEVKDLSNLKEISDFAGYQFADPSTDEGKTQSSLEKHNTVMNYKQFFDKRVFEKIAVKEIKNGVYLATFSINHADGIIQKEIFRKAYPNAYINVKKDPISHGKTITNESLTITPQKVSGGKNIKVDEEADQKADDKKIKNIRDALNSFFTITIDDVEEHTKDTIIWESFLHQEKSLREVISSSKPSKGKVDRNKEYKYELKSDAELMEMFKPKKEQRWEQVEEEGEEVSHQVNWEESQEEFKVRVEEEINNIKNDLPKKLTVKRLKGLTSGDEYQTLDGQNITSTQIKNYNNVTPKSEEFGEDYKGTSGIIHDSAKERFGNYIKTLQISKEPKKEKTTRSKHDVPFATREVDRGVSLSDTVLDKIWPMVEKFIGDGLNIKDAQPIINEIIENIRLPKSGGQQRLQEVLEWAAGMKGGSLSEEETTNLKRWALTQTKEAQDFNEAELKKHSLDYSAKLGGELVMGLASEKISEAREAIESILKSKYFYKYLKSVGVNMDPWYLRNYKFEIGFDQAAIKESTLKYKKIAISPKIETTPVLEISKKSLIASSKKPKDKSAVVTPEIHKPPKGKNPASAAIEYIHPSPSKSKKEEWDNRKKAASSLDKKEKQKVYAEIAEERKQWASEQSKGFNEAKEFWGMRIMKHINRLKKVAPYIRTGTE